MAAFFLAAVLVACNAGQDVSFEGVVVRLGDGDSLTVRTQSGAVHELRLHGVDCPELRQEYGPQALAAAEGLALGARVSVSVMDEDQYGRLVALVALPGGAVLNRELVRLGAAWVYGRYCVQDYCDEWRADEDEARARGLGLWAAEGPEPPGRWRMENGGRR